MKATQLMHDWLRLESPALHAEKEFEEDYKDWVVYKIHTREEREEGLAPWANPANYETEDNLGVYVDPVDEEDEEGWFDDLSVVNEEGMEDWEVEAEKQVYEDLANLEDCMAEEDYYDWACYTVWHFPVVEGFWELCDVVGACGSDGACHVYGVFTDWAFGRSEGN